MSFRSAVLVVAVVASVAACKERGAAQVAAAASAAEVPLILDGFFVIGEKAFADPSESNAQVAWEAGCARWKDRMYALFPPKQQLVDRFTAALQVGRSGASFRRPAQDARASACTPEVKAARQRRENL